MSPQYVREEKTQFWKTVFFVFVGLFVGVFMGFMLSFFVFAIYLDFAHPFSENTDWHLVPEPFGSIVFFGLLIVCSLGAVWMFLAGMNEREKVKTAADQVNELKMKL